MQSSLKCLESPRTVFKRQERLELRSEQEHGWIPTALLLSHHNTERVKLANDLYLHTRIR